MDRAIVDVCVVGGGPAGLACALALSGSGATIRLVTAPHRPAGNAPDLRTAALFTGSIALLQNLGVWDGCAANSAELKGIRLIDDTGGVLRAPEIAFSAHEVDLARFGYNVPQGPLVSALEAEVAKKSSIERIESAGVTAVQSLAEMADITLAEGDTFSARLVAAADGRNSICRKGAGIGVDQSSYEQTAIVCTFAHSRPHDGISTEFHRLAGPLTTVPMPGDRSSLVWVEKPAIAKRLLALDDVDFTRVLEDRLCGLLGALDDLSPRVGFPLSSLKARKMGANRVALVGEAGHVMPPIGAQGLNLSLRDVAVLADLVADQVAKGPDPGAADVLDAYDQARGGDVRMRGVMIDVLNTSLTSPLVPVQLARGLGLHALNTIGPLRRRLIKEGLQPSGPLPRLMRDREPSVHLHT